MVSNLSEALDNGSAKEEIIEADRMIEVEEFEDEGACFLFEVEEKKLLLLYGQECYPSSRFPCTDFSLIEILDSKGNPVDSLMDKRGEKLKPCKTISAKDPLKQLIPYDDRFVDCGLDELEEHLTG